MRVTERYGPPIFEYRGTCTVSVREAETSFSVDGSFEAAQFASGQIAVGVIPTRTPQPTRIELHSASATELAFTGNDLDKWSIKTTGDVFFSRIPWLFLPLAASKPTELGFGAQYIEASRRTATSSRYSRARFLISNMLWHGSTTKDPEPIGLAVPSYRLSVTAIDDYQDAAYRLSHGRDVEPTAWVCVETLHDETKGLDDFRLLMDDLMFLFRLVTGNLVDWYYGETYVCAEQEPVERVHRYTTPTSYSNTIRFEHKRSGYMYLHPKLDICELATAYFDQSGYKLSAKELKTLTNQFTTACGDSDFFESSGLLASTLTELIVSRVATANQTSNIISKRNYESRILPALKEAVSNLDLAKEERLSILQHIAGAYRKSFRHKLEALRDECELPLTDSDIGLIVRTRNALVHRGTFHSNAEDGGWGNDYGIMVWTNLIALCRLLGYTGELPERRDGRPIVV